MKKNNNKGFMLLETLVVSAFVITILIYLYVQFVNLKNSYDESFKYDTIQNIYSLKQVDQFINKNYGYGDFKDILVNENYIELYKDKCEMEYFSNNNSYCNKLMSNLNMKTLLITNNRLEDIKSQFKTNNPYSRGLYNYIKSIDRNMASKSYLLIAEFKDNTYGYLKLDDVVFGGKFVAANPGDTHKGIVYIDPTDLTAKCDEEHAVSTAGTIKGCMKFYVFDDSGEKYKMILDHNTSGPVAWINQADYIEAGGTQYDWIYAKYNTQGPVTAMKQLQEDTDSWQVSTRLIKADEIAQIVGADREDTLKWSQSKTYVSDYTNKLSTEISWFLLEGGKNSGKTSYSDYDGWKKQVAIGSTKSDYAWLYDYTNGCEATGCNYNDSAGSKGYWTMDGVVGLNGNQNAWFVNRAGNIVASGVLDSSNWGVRPVIEINKNYIN